MPAQGALGQREVFAVPQSRVLCMSSCWESADNMGCVIGKLFQTRHGSHAVVLLELIKIFGLFPSFQNDVKIIFNCKISNKQRNKV